MNNGQVIQTTTNTTSLSSTLDLSIPGNGDKGDVISVNVTPYDGTDTGATATATTTVVDSPPVAPDGTTSVGYNNNTGVDITLVATDADGDPLTYSLVGPNGGTAGIVTLTGDVAHYTPTIGRVGIDTFQWTASDGTETSSTATETINLTDAPPVVVSTSFDVTENTPLTIAAPGSLPAPAATAMPRSL